MKARAAGPDYSWEALSAHLYLQGVLPALAEFSESSHSPLASTPRGRLNFRGPKGLYGSWPHQQSRTAGSPNNSPGLTLHFFSAKQIVSLFEKGFGFFLPGRGWQHLGLLWVFQKNGKAFQRTIQKEEVPPEVFQIQLHLLLRLSCLLYEANELLRKRVGALPEGHVNIRMGGEGGVESWFGFETGKGLIWGPGAAPSPVRGTLEIPDRKTVRQVFAGQLIGEEAVSDGRVRMRGHIPFIQSVNLVFESLERYVKPL